MSDERNSQQDVIGEEYASSLADLTVNSKPLINMLTMLAEENAATAPVIVKVIEKHLSQVLNSTFKLLLINTFLSTIVSHKVCLYSMIITFPPNTNPIFPLLVVVLNTWSYC